MKKSTKKLIKLGFQTLINILAAAITALSTTSCMGV